MRVLVETSVCLFLAQALFLVLGGKGAVANPVNRDAQGGADHQHNFESLDEHLSSVLHLLVHGDGGSNDGLRTASVGPSELPRIIDALEDIASLVTVRRSLGLEHVHELDDPRAAQLVTALSRRVPAKVQEALKLLRSILVATHGLLSGHGSGHGASGASGNSGGSTAEGATAAAVPELSYPLLRRATVARLTQLWLMHLRGRGAGSVAETQSGPGSDPASSPSPKVGGWATAARRDVGRTLLLLFRLHRGGMQGRVALEFLHISKAAGTSMCRLAEASGCHAQDFSMGRTCLMREFDDQPRWINGSHHWKVIANTAEPWGSHPYAFLLYGVPRGPKRKRTCPLRLAVLEKYRLDFFANEYTIYNNLTSYSEPELEKEHGNEEDADVPPSRRPPRLPPSPRTPPQPPQSVVFEATAARYAAYVSQLLAAEGTAGAGAGAEAAAAGGEGYAGRGLAGAQGLGGIGGGGSGSSGSGSGGASPIMKGAHLCRQFANVAVMRDPGERFSSHLTFIAQTYGTMYQWPGIALAFAPGRTSAAWWRAFSPPLFDNYMLRSLGGEALFAMSYDSLEAGAVSFMALAKAMLAQYDVILVLEADEGCHRRACHFGLGWRHLLQEFQLRNASALLKKMQELQVYGADLSLLLPEEPLFEELKRFAVRYDNQLYKYGRVLAALDDLVWRVAAEALGEPLSGFWSGSGPKCGYVSSRAGWGWGPPAVVSPPSPLEPGR